jgi:UDP-galactopyranose mutase
LVVASKAIGLEVNAEKNKYMVVSRDLNAGRSHNIKIDVSFARVEEFRYLETALTNQNSIQEEIKSRLKLGNACYHSVQNLLSSSLLYKHIKIKICRIIILLVSRGCETWLLTLRE